VAGIEREATREETAEAVVQATGKAEARRKLVRAAQEERERLECEARRDKAYMYYLRRRARFDAYAAEFGFILPDVRKPIRGR